MNISIEKAKQIREDIGATHLIMLVRAADGSDNVATHGENEQQAHEAAAAGNQLKKLLGWPYEFCHSVPQPREEWKPTRTAHEQQAIDNINAALSDGAAPGAWADCGEVDVEVLLTLVNRLTRPNAQEAAK